MPTLETHAGPRTFDRDTIVGAILYSAIAAATVHYHWRAPLWDAPWDVIWSGDRTRGEALLDNREGDTAAVAWDAAGLVALEFELGFGPLEALNLRADAITGGPEDVRRAVAGMPEPLEDAFQRAARLLHVGNQGELSATAGLWIHGDDVACSNDGTPHTPGLGILRWAFSSPFARRGPPPAIPAEQLERHERAAATVAGIAHRAGRGRVDLTEEEIAALPAPRAPQDITGMKRALATVGVRWATTAPGQRSDTAGPVAPPQIRLAAGHRGRTVRLEVTIDAARAEQPGKNPFTHQPGPPLAPLPTLEACVEGFVQGSPALLPDGAVTLLDARREGAVFTARFDAPPSAPELFAPLANALIQVSVRWGVTAIALTEEGASSEEPVVSALEVPAPRTPAYPFDVSNRRVTFDAARLRVAFDSALDAADAERLEQRVRAWAGLVGIGGFWLYRGKLSAGKLTRAELSSSIVWTGHFEGLSIDREGCEPLVAVLDAFNASHGIVEASIVEG